MPMTLLLLTALACSATPSAFPLGDVTAPEIHLGRPLGADRLLVDWGEVSSYFHRLAEESPRVLVAKVGESTEGRDFLLATISSEENLARLEELKGINALLADPRGADDEALERATREGRIFLFISCAMHATECAGSQLAMGLAHELATSDEEPWKSAREECVVLLVPSLNPDGLDQVTEWYRRTVGTPYEATELLELYQHYTGHDNNRDWFMLTQAETRIVTELLYETWRPQVFWDVHQHGRSRERFFVPPFRDPLNPNLDAGIIAGIDVLGSRALLDLCREGRGGVATGVSFDMWWNGGNRNVPVRHNMIGLLTEAASARLATPVFLPPDQLRAPSGLEEYAPSHRFPLPWPGGWWRLRDIIDYELAFARSLLGSLSRERSFWLRGAVDASRRAIAVGEGAAPRGWILPSNGRDPGAVARLVDVLLAAGVELSVSSSEISTDGRRWPAGSIVIDRAQPYGAHVKDLFDVQRYPGSEPPYDIAGWTLPFLLGVRRVETMELPVGELEPVTDIEQAIAGFGGDPRLAGTDGALMSTRDSRSWPTVYDGLAAGKSYYLKMEGESEGLFFDGGEQQEAIRSLPRIGLYAPWRGSIDEGWTRWVFDTERVPYVRVRNENLRAGVLRDFFDVLVIPSISSREIDSGRAPGTVEPRYSRGMEAEGAVAIEEFVRGGGTLITLGSSSAWAIDLFGLPLVDVTREEDAGGFSCPGSVLRATPRPGPYTAGLPLSLPVFFSRSSAWRVTDESEEGEVESLLDYASTRLLMSGWVEEPEVIEGRSAWVTARVGEGTLHLFAFRPQYRGWAQATFSLLHRAILVTPTLR
jgi:hypothetical protein